MREFELIERDIDVAPILAELDRAPELWDAQTGRRRIAVQREALAIPIRGLRKSMINGRKRRDVHESRFTTISRSLPATVSFIQAWAATLGATLGRAKVVCLPPGKVVYAHRDRGEYYARRDRYHLVLRSAGSRMRAGDEEVTMQERELWWFNNKAEHEARNDSDVDRVHLIFDLEPNAENDAS